MALLLPDGTYKVLTLHIHTKVHATKQTHVQTCNKHTNMHTYKRSYIYVYTHIHTSYQQETNQAHLGKKRSISARILSGLENMTGLDIDGDGQIQSEHAEYDPNTDEVHMLITTIEGGHNSGKTYILRLPGLDVADWMDTLTNAVKKAKAAKERRFLEEEFGYSKMSRFRCTYVYI